MNLSTPIKLGLFIGLLAAAVVWHVWPDLPEPAPARSLHADCEGTIDTLVLHYTPDARDVVLPVYRSFLPQLESEIRVAVLCPSREAFDELRQAVGEVRCTLRYVQADHPMTSWSRDRWIALASDESPVTVQLLRPHQEAGRDQWPARKGDEQAAHSLAAAMPNVSAVQSKLRFDGGDFVCDAEAVFVTPRAVLANVGTTVQDRDELRERLARLTGKRVVLLQTAPEHHAGMFLMPVGSRTVIVADPKPLDDESTQAAGLASEQCNAVANQIAALGYRVVRIPIAVASDGRTYQTPLNAILDVRHGQRIVYMPTYQDASDLGSSARALWESLGYQVREVDCTTSYRHAGSLRCLVNIVSRHGIN